MEKGTEKLLGAEAEQKREAGGETCSGKVGLRLGKEGVVGGHKGKLFQKSKTMVLFKRGKIYQSLCG